MNGRGRIGVVTTVATFALGAWLFLAPFMVGYQEVRGEWTDATRNDLRAGGALLLLSVLTLLAFSALALRDASHRAAMRRRDEMLAAG